jgi:N-acetylgalactosamine kinase|eukprot:evm.model.NODE_53430_length_16188_cov_24.397146.3
MALEDYTAMIAVGMGPSPSHNGVKVLNLDEAKFPETRVLSLMSSTYRSDAPHDWIRYVECALQGVRREFSGTIDETKLNGLVLVVHGTVPPAAGLSSSSALVVAAALAFCWSVGKGDIRKATLAALCVECERSVGTAGGGMDQTVSCLAEPGKALLIEFEPGLKATTVPLPQGIVVVVADCGVTSEKAVSATTHFNRRVVECQLATWVLAKSAGLEDWSSCETLHQLEQYFGALGALVHHLPAGQVPVRKLQRSMSVGDFFPPFPDKHSEVAELVVANTTSFNLRDRAVHVLNEADRVQRFAALCHSAAATISCAQSLGVLMNESHTSCMNLYECSCPELDELVAVCQAAPGCFGARLTGAGWGGMCVALCDEGAVDAFMADVKEKFYKQREKDDDGGESPLMFVTRPGGGAGVVLEGEMGE